MSHSDKALHAYREYLNPNNADFLQRIGLDSIVLKAKDAQLWDDKGREFIDFVAGYGLFNLGHNPAPVTEALTRELEKQPLWSRPFLNEPLANLATKLVEMTPGDLNRVFVCSSGSEAVETAIKLARLATRRPEIIAANGAYHGFTMGALSVSGVFGQSRPFQPLLPGITHVPFGDADALEAAVSADTAAVLLEPYQAEIGAATPDEGYLSAAREICDRFGVLLMIDEVRTGMGRTGTLFAVEHEGVVPDVMMLGKSLGAGIVPIGAVVAREDIWGRFGLSFSMSASSWSGNRLACVSALAALAIVEDEGFLQNARTAEEILWDGLDDIASEYPDTVSQLTGKGVLVGVHLHNNRAAGDVIKAGIARDLLIGTAFCNGRCILIEPPLVIEPRLLKSGLSALREAFDEVSRSQ